MALVSGARSSSLNPNAPLFIPAAVRQVEDFSPEWWDLVTTASWFRDYWLSQHQGDDIFGEEDYGLPDNIDLDVDEDILNMEAQYEEFLHSSSQAEYGFKPTPGHVANGFGKNVDALMRSLSLGKERGGPKSPREVMMKHQWEKPAKMSPKQQGPRFIQQPR